MRITIEQINLTELFGINNDQEVLDYLSNTLISLAHEKTIQLFIQNDKVPSTLVSKMEEGDSKKEYNPEVLNDFMALDGYMDSYIEHVNELKLKTLKKQVEDLLKHVKESGRPDMVADLSTVENMNTSLEEDNLNNELFEKYKLVREKYKFGD